MCTLTLATILQASILMTGVTDANSYSAAHKTSKKTGRPMIVLVGADWCPACVEMKDKVIPQVERRGLLRKVAFAIVNLDRQRKLGSRLTGGGPIPQVIMYRKTRNGWRQRKLIGGHDPNTLSAFIEEGIRLNENAQKSKDKKESPPKDKPKRST